MRRISLTCALLFAILIVAIDALAQLFPAQCSARFPCVPPATYRIPNAPPPFDAPVRYGGETKLGGEIYWVWIKNGEPSKPCTAAQASDRNAYEYGCSRKIGEPLYVTRQFPSAVPQ